MKRATHQRLLICHASAVTPQGAPTKLRFSPRSVRHVHTVLHRGSLPVADDWERRLPILTAELLDDVNHYTLMFDGRGTTRIAQIVNEG